MTLKHFTEAAKLAAFNALHIFTLGKPGSLYSKSGNTEIFTDKQRVRFKFGRKLVTTGQMLTLKLSGGRLGNSFLGKPIVLLTTIGHKSGLPRTVPTFYVQDNERIFLVGTNGGSNEDPLWLRNARVNPRVTIERRGQRQEMMLRVATKEEKARYWPMLTEYFPPWQEVADRSGRDVPVIILEAAAPCENAGFSPPGNRPTAAPERS